MSRTVRCVLAVLVLQVALFLVYVYVERQRPHAPSALTTAPPERVHLPMPRLAVQRRDGRTMELSSFGRPTLVHIWATWCPPCRAELPGLLALPDAHALNVMTIALDRDWADVERFLGRKDASRVLLADSAHVGRALGVRRLPVTFLVHENRIALRFEGARDWTEGNFVGRWLEEFAEGRR